MRHRFVVGAGLLIAIFSSYTSRSLAVQSGYPIQGQPQGGDRRGSYYSEGEDAQKSYDEKRALSRFFPDPKLYLDNMTLLAHLPGRFYHKGLMTVGGNRYLFTGGASPQHGPGLVVDVTNPKQPVVINERAPRGDVAYNRALQKWILMALNSSEPPGVTFFDVSDPRNIVEISSFSAGAGTIITHNDGQYYDGGRYAYLVAGLPEMRRALPDSSGLVLEIIDVSNIKNPKEVSKWWVPGQRKDEEAEFLKWPEAERVMKQEQGLIPQLGQYHLEFNGPCIVPKRVEDGGNRAYCAWSSLGMRILDLSDIRQPKLISTVDVSPPFEQGNGVHSVYPIPQRKLAFMNGENTRWDCYEGIAMPWVVDLRAERYPVTIATFPIPKPPVSAPYNDFCFRGGRFSTHAPHEIRAPGQARIDLMGYSWFEGGWRLYDISNPFRPEEVASVVPPQGTFRGTEYSLIEWDRKIIHVFADTGLYTLSTPVLGEPVLGPLRPERWTPEGLNIGAP